MNLFRWAMIFCLSATLAQPAFAGGSKDAILAVAHGGSKTWNDRVAAIATSIEWEGPVGVAFLMNAPPEHELAAVVAQLEQRGASRIIVVPLLVSSYSNHFEEIRYYAGARDTAPEHAHHSPLKTRATLLVAGAMDDHSLISRILQHEIQKISKTPEQESVVLVAHGPNDDADNALWIESLGRHAARLRQAFAFKRIEIVTLRDDAPKPIRDIATQQLRGVVSNAAADSRVVVVPVLVSVGLIQDQIKERLQGLRYEMAMFGIVDSPLIKVWIKEQALHVLSAAVRQGLRLNFCALPLQR